jgi:hypothetical protein
VLLCPVSTGGESNSQWLDIDQCITFRIPMVKGEIHQCWHDKIATLATILLYLKPGTPARVNRTAASVNTTVCSSSHSVKRKLINVWCVLIQHFKGPLKIQGKFQILKKSRVVCPQKDLFIYIFVLFLKTDVYGGSLYSQYMFRCGLYYICTPGDKKREPSETKCSIKKHLKE